MPMPNAMLLTFGKKQWGKKFEHMCEHRCRCRGDRGCYHMCGSGQSFLVQVGDTSSFFVGVDVPWWKNRPPTHVSILLARYGGGFGGCCYCSCLINICHPHSPWSSYTHGRMIMVVQSQHQRETPRRVLWHPPWWSRWMGWWCRRFFPTKNYSIITTACHPITFQMVAGRGAKGYRRDVSMFKCDYQVWAKQLTYCIWFNINFSLVKCSL